MKHLRIPALPLAFAALSAACGHSNANTSPGSSFDASSGRDAAPANTDSGPPIVLPGKDASTPQGALAISPPDPVLTVISGSAVPTQQFTAQVGGVPISAAVWTLDHASLGSLSATGLFTPSGTAAGVGHIQASAAGQTATTTVTVTLQSSNSGDPGWTAHPPDAGAGGYGGVGGAGPGAPPDGGQTATLNGTPTADPTVTLLYPYDGTVWPQGILAPLLQWNPGAHSFDSVYVHITEPNFEYKGYFAANATPFINLPIPQAAWDALTYSSTGQPITISLVFAEGAKAYGPYSQTWKVAKADLHGTIYYNSYGTELVHNSGTDGLDAYQQQYGAGTLAITTGDTAPKLVAGANSVNPSGDGSGCRVCHTVAANGQSLLTQASDTSVSTYATTVYLDLAHDTTGGAGTAIAAPDLTYPALYKDGTLVLSGSGGMIDTDSASRLYSLPAGTPVAGVTGLPTNFQAALPSFSPDGKHLSFNFWGGTFPAVGTTPAITADQVSLAILDFDGKSAFTNPRLLYTPPAGTSVTYSSFLPDSSGIVFEIELTNPSSNWGDTWGQNTAELWWLELKSGKATRLGALNGYDLKGAVYLPSPGGSVTTHTPAQDVTLNYEPTVNPIASGGYAWVVFTTRRMYGNVAQLDPWTSDPRNYKWRDEVTDKKLWVAALDLGGAGGSDPSHPAFYLPAQELHAGNARGYWTVAPCRANGTTCSTGDQCCGGYCSPEADGGLACTQVPPSCSGQFDKCSTTGDCCSGGGLICINGICSLPVPQ